MSGSEIYASVIVAILVILIVIRIVLAPFIDWRHSRKMARIRRDQFVTSASILDLP